MQIKQATGVHTCVLLEHRLACEKQGSGTVQKEEGRKRKRREHS
jgi:hypothetical protein